MKLKNINKSIDALLVCLVLLFGTSFFLRHRLPGEEMILPELFQEPKQTEVRAEATTFEYRGAEYKVSPQASYELWGLIVDRNDIDKLGDIYHDEDSVDLLDICVVWGENVKSDVYRKMKFRSGSWTCYWSTSSNETWKAFKAEAASNNHLIASDPVIQDELRSLHKGDQIYLRGILADYTNLTTNWTRQTSLTRADTGNGACEVVYVEELEVLKAGQPLWFKLYEVSWKLFLLLLVIKIVLVSYESYLHVKQARREP